MSIQSAALTILHDRRQVLATLAAVLGVTELADAFAISFWEGALAFGLLYVAGAWWTRRGGIGGPVLIAALSAFEIQAFVGWSRGGVADWTLQIGFLIGSAISLILVFAVLKAARDLRVRRRLARAEA